MAITKKLEFEFERLLFKKLFVISFVASLIMVLLGLISQVILPPEIPLYYGLPQTSEQITKSIYIIVPSLLSCLFISINILIAIKISDIFLKKALAITSIATSALAIITTYKIIMLVGGF